LHID
jgi:hypothetical protein